MALGNLSIDYSERLYNALLSLYPVHFRVRFAPEMVQLFRDCAHDALEKGQVAVLVVFWLRVMRDLFVSVVRERGRGWMSPLNAEHPLVGIIDLLLIPSMVVANLVALGPILTLLFRGNGSLPPEEFLATSGFFSLAIGTLSVVASLLATKLRPTVRVCIKLSAGE
jgi:hypothetical protein